MSNQIWRIVVLGGFRLFIFRACERAHARTLETSERIVIGRGIAGEACQITNGNRGHAQYGGYDGLAEKTRETNEASGQPRALHGRPKHGPNQSVSLTACPCF